MRTDQSFFQSLLCVDYFPLKIICILKRHFREPSFAPLQCELIKVHLIRSNDIYSIQKDKTLQVWSLILALPFNNQVYCTYLVAQLVKNPPATQEIPVGFLGREDTLEKGKATHSSILALRIPWTI